MAAAIPGNPRSLRDRAWGIALMVGVSGCVPPTPVISPNAAAPPSVAATWGRDATQRSRVELRANEQPLLTTEWQDAGLGEVSMTLLGVPPGTDGTAAVVWEDGAESDAVPFTSPFPPTDFPEIALAGTPGWEGFLVVPMLSGSPYLAVLDEAGVVLWTTPLPDDPLVGGRPQVMRSGEGVWIGVMNPDPARLLGVSWAGEVVLDESLSGFSHDFAELEDGELIWIAAECDAVDEHPFCVNTVERGVPGGETRTLWRATDTFDPETDGERNDRGDWMHANALNVDEARGRVWLGLRNESVMVELNLETGEVIRQVGGPYSDYLPTTADALTQGQHRFQVFDDDEMIVFDNRLDDARGSRVATLKLDDTAGTVSLIDEYNPQPPRWSSMLGDVNRWDDGSTVVTWTTSGVIEDVGADGALRSSLSAELGTGFGYTLRLASLPGLQ